MIVARRQNAFFIGNDSSGIFLDGSNKLQASKLTRNTSLQSTKIQCYQGHIYGVGGGNRNLELR